MDFYQDKNVAIVEKPRNVAITERWQFVKVWLYKYWTHYNYTLNIVHVFI